MVVSSSVVCSLACLWWSVWLLRCSCALSGKALKWPSGHFVVWSASACQPAVLAACDASIVERAVRAATSMVQDVWWLSACVRAEMRTHMCEKGCGVAAVAIAVDR